MDTFDILNCLKRKKTFVGVFACDQLPKTKLRKPCVLIVNTDPSYKTGVHWVAIKLNTRISEYFDSYGLYPVNYEIIQFLDKQNGKGKWMFNMKCLQDIHSIVCGQYVCTYANFKGSLTDYIKQFSANTKENDKLVCKLFNSQFKNCIPSNKFGQICRAKIQ